MGRRVLDVVLVLALTVAIEWSVWSGSGALGTKIAGPRWLTAALVFFFVVAFREGLRGAWCLPFVIALLFRIFGPFRRAFQSLAPEAIRAAEQFAVVEKT